jgi:hypothetical protein
MIDIIMIKFYLNRELADCLGFKLSRWKRWSREFLPPDPLGGLQSGFARQYNLADAFHVYLGGHLVADLNFPIPETRIILEDLKPWVRSQFFPHSKNNVPPSVALPAKEYRIHIFTTRADNETERERRYAVRRLIDEKMDGKRGTRMITERYLENWLEGGEFVSGDTDADKALEWGSSRILYISKLYERFKRKLTKGSKDSNSTKP